MDSTALTFDPSWPWSLPDIGMTGLFIAAGVLTALTVWTYLGVRGKGGRRLLLVLFLRLAALLVACLLVLRPSLAFSEDESALPSKLILLADSSESMNFTDEFDGLSRWKRAHALINSTAVQAALKRLASEQRVEVVYYQGAEDIGPINADGPADGKRTEMGQWLHAIWQAHGREKRLRGLVLLTDGADNGTRFPTLEKAVPFRGACPIHPFGLGRPNNVPRQNDIAFVANKIFVEPTPVHVKNQFTVKCFVNAPGFWGARPKLSLFIDDKFVKAEVIHLNKTQENEVQITADAPVRAGEIKVTLKIEPLQGEVTAINNEISTYVTVIKEGVSVLWVEGKKRAYESVFAIRYALKPDRRFRVFYTERLKEEKPSARAADWYKFDKQHYDVIVIGDISASRFAGGDPQVFSKVRELVEKKGSGLIMLGGYETFANSDWQVGPARELSELLPVELNQPGQVDRAIQVTPTEKGLDYLLRLDNDPKQNLNLWTTKLEALDGMTKLGAVRAQATVLAKAEGDVPILAGRQVDSGRTLVFGGDSTWRAWRRSKEAIEAHQRFWKQMILWAAHQEQAEGDVRVLPDTRRLPAGSNQRLGFTVEMYDKGGIKRTDARFKVKVIGPNREEYDVPTGPEDKKERGYFWKTSQPGEYRIVATAIGEKDKSGEAKFLCYPEDVENLRPAADHDFLKKLAQAGGGKFALADEQNLVRFLHDLAGQKADATRPKADLWPDWRRNPPSDSFGDQLETLWNSTALPFFLLFATFLCLEWFFRRRWGLV
jgi:uncharacterized membrane protein